MKHSRILFAVSVLAFSAFLSGCGENAGDLGGDERKNETQNEKTNMSETTKSPDFIERDGARWVRVCTLSSARANEEFLRNVNVMRAQRKAVLDAKNAGNAARSEELLKKLNANNAVMVKTYGYSLVRDYLQRIVKTRVFVKLSDAEFAAARKESNLAEGELVERDGGKFRLIATIDGVGMNDEFRGNVALVQRQRAAIVEARAGLEKLSGEARSAREAEISAAEKKLVENNAAMTRRYGFTLARDYLMEIVESELFVKAK